MTDNAVPHPIENDITVVRKISPVEKMWKNIAFFVGLVAAGGGILGVLGQAFYVSKNEYTQKVIADSVQRTEIQGALRELKNAMDEQRRMADEQKQALSGLVDKVNEINIKIASGGRR